MRIPPLFNRIRNELNFRFREKVDQTRIVVFVLPSEDLISGGVMSVISIYRELKKLEHDLGINVFLSTHPQAPHFEGYTMHNRDVKVYGFKHVITKVLPDSTILFHIPEAHVIQFFLGLRHTELDKLKDDKRLTYDVNILNQNPVYFPKKEELRLFISRIRDLTQTTAHYAYNKQFKLGDRLVPSSYLSAYVGIDISEVVPYEKKRNAILVSHDDHPQKESVLKTLQKAIPNLEIIVVNNIPFEEYTELQKSCKFGLTFGEGVDSYFVQCILDGGIGFAVANPVFFTEDIKAFPTVFESFEKMQENLPRLINEMNAPISFSKTVNEIRPVLGKYYRFAAYTQRIEHLHTNWKNNQGIIATKEIW